METMAKPKKKPRTKGMTERKAEKKTKMENMAIGIIEMRGMKEIRRIWLIELFIMPIILLLWAGLSISIILRRDGGLKKRMIN